jgi:hypothetical protein
MKKELEDYEFGGRYGNWKYCSEDNIIEARVLADLIKFVKSLKELINRATKPKYFSIVELLG